MQGLFLGLSYDFDSSTGCPRSFGGGSIRFSTKSFAPCFDLLITSLLAISTC